MSSVPAMMCLYRSLFLSRGFLLSPLQPPVVTRCHLCCPPASRVWLQGNGLRFQPVGCWAHQRSREDGSLWRCGIWRSGHEERVGRGGFPPWLGNHHFPLCTPSSLFWVLEKGIWNSGPQISEKTLPFPAPVKPHL